MGHFLPFYPTIDLKLNLEQMLKKRGDILLHMCTTNEDHMIYGSWDIRHNGQIFLSFWAIFYTLTLLTIRKIKILKKWKRKKTSGDTKLFKLVYHKWPSHDVWFLRYGVRQTGFFVILDHFWHVTRDGRHYFSFLGYFVPFAICPFTIPVP